MSGQKEKRAYPRRHLWYPAKIDFGDGSEIRDCQLRDVSVKGARLMIGKLENLPEQFTLLLSNIGNSHRRCRIAWRAENEAGVEFVAEP